MLEIEIKQNVDSNLCSMGKEKKGNNPDKLSLAAKKRKKAAKAREKKKKKLEEERLEKERVEKEKMEEELRQKEEIKKKKQQEKTKKPKPPPKFGLGSVKEPTRSSPKLKKNLPAPGQPTRSSPGSSRTLAQTGGIEEAADPGVIRTPETPLPQVLVGDDEPALPTAKELYRRPMQNPQINPLTGRPYTLEAEKRAIRFLMEQGEEAKQAKERRDETLKKRGKMSKDLIPKRKRTPAKISVEESSESSSDEEQPKKKPAKVVNKRVGGGAMRKRWSRKGATPASQKKGK